MIRLKILLLAVAALGLWAAHVMLLTPSLARRGLDAARTAADKGALLVEAQAYAQLQTVTRATLKLSSRTGLEEKLSWRRSAPNVEQLNIARTLVLGAMPEALQAAATVGLVNEAGQLWAGDDAEPKPNLGELETSVFANSSDPAILKVVGNQLYALGIIPLGNASEGAKRPLVVLAMPLPLRVWTTDAARSSSLVGVGVFSQGQLVAFNPGADKQLIRSEPKLGKLASEVVERGPTQMLGPLELPFFAGEGLETPSLVAARRYLDAEGLEIVALAPTEPFFGALADYQRFALFASLGFLGLAIIASLVTGQAEDAPRMSVPETIRGPVRSPTATAFPVQPAAPSFSGGMGAGSPSRGPSTLGELQVMDSPSAMDEASPDDFHFGHTRVSAIPSAIEPQPEHTDAGFRSPFPPEPAFSPPPPVASAPPPPRRSAPETDFVPTASYSLEQRMDPFAVAGNEYGGDIGSPEDNPEATRVAVIPEALLRESAQSTVSGPASVPVQASTTFDGWRVEPVAPVAAPPVDEDEAHFHSVFQEYVATRQRCGEGGESLPYERFAAKLRKNKDQLVQKYGCRTVRFQVYVKDGKAALKATPVKA